MTAYDLASQEAHAIRRAICDALNYAIESGEVTDAAALSDRLREEIDNALIYTSDQWVCAYGLRQHRDPFSEGLLDTPESIEQVIGLQAYLNLEDSIDLSDFDDALAVAADKRAEKEGA
jgi:hypothetical protein